MKNSIIIIALLLFFYIGNSYAQFIYIAEELPSENYYNENIGTTPQSIAFLDDGEGINLFAADPWRPNPDEGDESTGGVPVDAGIGNGTLALFILSLMYSIFILRKRLGIGFTYSYMDR